jgi:hypothetical protein
MYRIAKFFSFPFVVAVLMASDASWMTKPLPEWSQQDARQLLASSPWVKYVTPAPLPSVTEAQRRQGGVMGGGRRGVGLEPFSASSLIGFGTAAKSESNPEFGHLRPVAIRWESSMPVRSAELKAGESKVPQWAGDYYVIAIYGTPAAFDKKNVESELASAAVLTLDHKKTIKPVRVDISASGKGSVRIMYLFPRSRRITTDCGEIEFMAQFDQLYVAQFFHPQEMQFQGKLEL